MFSFFRQLVPGQYGVDSDVWGSPDDKEVDVWGNSNKGGCGS